MLDNTSGPHGLNRAQQTAVTVTLRQLEEALQKVVAVLDGAPEGRLTRIVTELAPAQRQAAEQTIAALWAEIARTADAFDLAPEVWDGRRVILGQLAIAWESLEDTRSARLRAYGVVDPALQQTLDPHIERLIALVLALEDQVRGSVGDTGAPAR